MDDLPAKCNTKHPHQTCQDTCRGRYLYPSYDEVGECAGKQHEHPQKKKDKEASDMYVVCSSVLYKSYRIVPTKIHDSRHETIPSNLNKDVR